ncbi:MAG: Fic family protein [Gemmatimonadaceae bacterium]
MLFKCPDLDDSELRAAERVRQLKESLNYVVQVTPKRWQGVLRRSTLARAVRASNSIEGYNVTVDDAIALAEGQEPLDANAEARAAVEGYQQAMTYVIQLANDPHFRFSVDLIRSLHFMMIDYDLTKNPGRWRPGPIYVRDDEKNAVVYEAPDAELVPGLAAELVDELNANDPARPDVVRAAMGHLDLAMIHPFSDGNGRMARCLQSLILARSGTLAPQFSSIEEYLGNNTRAYYDVLARVGGGTWQPKRNARPWIRFCLTAHFQQATDLLRRTRDIDRLWNSMEEEIRKHRLPDRLIFALADAAVGYRVRNGTYRPTAEISEQVAGRDLALAVRAGLLIARGERRGRYYEKSSRLLGLRASTREKRVAPGDPFAA